VRQDLSKVEGCGSVPASGVERTADKSAVSQDGWQVIFDEDLTRTWAIPGSDRTFELRHGSAGFVFAWLASWFDDRIEAVLPGTDDWGWGLRKIGGTDVWSNHASATAIDLNALRHPQGSQGTFTDAQASRIRDTLDTRLHGLVRWGGDYRTTKDEMHFEFLDGVVFEQVRELALELRRTARGKQILALNADG
jgi:hypothetical protein